MSKQSHLAHQNGSANEPCSHLRFFVRVDRVLRRSLGVSETAKTEVNIKPAPEVDPTEFEEEILMPDFPDYTPGMFGDNSQGPIVLDKDTGTNIHDEL